MTYTDRVTEIATRLATLPSAGKVHNRTRVSAGDWGKFIVAFKDTAGLISGWQVTRASADLAANSTRWDETYSLVRVYGLRDEDATDLAFQESLDDAVRLFRDEAEFSFGATRDGLRLRVIEERMFGGVLCHVAECELVVTQYLADL